MCVLQHHHQVPDDRYASAHGVRLDLMECLKRLDMTNQQVKCNQKLFHCMFLKAHYLHNNEFRNQQSHRFRLHSMTLHHYLPCLKQSMVDKLSLKRCEQSLLVVLPHTVLYHHFPANYQISSTPQVKIPCQHQKATA